MPMSEIIVIHSTHLKTIRYVVIHRKWKTKHEISCSIKNQLCETEPFDPNFMTICRKVFVSVSDFDSNRNNFATNIKRTPDLKLFLVYIFNESALVIQNRVLCVFIRNALSICPLLFWMCHECHLQLFRYLNSWNFDSVWKLSTSLQSEVCELSFSFWYELVVSFHGFSYCITFRFGALHSGIHYNISFWGKTIGEFSALFYKQSTSTYYNLWQEIKHILFGTTNFAIFTLTESLCAFFPNSLFPNFIVFGFFVLFVDEQLKLCEWTWTNVQKLCHFQIVLIENEWYSIGKSFKWKWQTNINKALPKNVIMTLWWLEFRLERMCA